MDEHDRRWRFLQVAVVVCAVGLLVVVAWYALLITGNEACDQDGGVEGDSPAGQFCGTVGIGWFFLGAVGLPLAIAFLGASVLRRKNRLRRLLFCVAVAGLLAALSAIAIPLSDECSNSKQRIDDRWSKAGAHGDPPADCESY